MSFLARNKYHFISGIIITILFIFSVHIRKENLSAPLARHHEWITAHTLITCEIWAENGGPSAYGFSPVYTYPGKGSQNRRMLGGVTDKEGNVYYVSYPPFSFLFAYYATKIIGGPDLDSIRTLNLSIHYLCALLIYLIGISLAKDSSKTSISIAGIFGAFLYLFSAGNLWIHGNLYFADTVVQLFLIAAIYFVIRFFKKDYKNEKIILSALFFLFFLATYTEWLGLFFAFFTGLAFLISYFMVKEKRFLKAFFTVGISATMALGLTVLQYSAIAGWNILKEVSEKKYDQRSGHESETISANGFNLENEAAFDNLMKDISYGFKMVENFVGITFILFIFLLLFRHLRKNLGNFQWHTTIFCLLALAILTHYYVFFNFNSLHDFSSLKTGFLMILIVLIFVSLIESVLLVKLKIILAIALIALAVDKGLESVEKYQGENPITAIEWERIETANAMRKYGNPELAMFMNVRFSTEMVYYAKHNVSPIIDSSDIVNMMKFSKSPGGQYYHHTNSKLDYILEFDKIGDSIIFTNKINLHIR